MTSVSNFAQKKDCQSAREVLHYCYKRLRQDYDILPPKDEKAFRKEIQMVQNAITARDPKLNGRVEKLIESHNRIFQDSGQASFRENGEVILVAFIIAMAFRAFFLQPFKIPTGSMQPTLNGVIVRPVQEKEKTWWYPVLSRPLWGEQRLQLTAQSPGRFEGLPKPVSRKFFYYGGKSGFFTFFPVDATQFRIGNEWYEVPVDIDKFNSDIKPDLKSNEDYATGEPILDRIIQTGDQLFVDRFTYYFRKPKRGEVFVFETRDIRDSHGGSLRGDFYIKRLAGVPGDQLRIADKKLYINGEIAKETGFQKVMSLQHGYQGYGVNYFSNSPDWLGHPESTVQLEKHQYFALGDNSFNSSDSRFWGTVDYHSIVGRGFFVFWPFSRHFGRIE